MLNRFSKLHGKVALKVSEVKMLVTQLAPWTFVIPWTNRLLCPRNSPGKNTGVDSCSHLQWIFTTQGLNPDIPYCRWILYQLSHQGIPIKLEWVAYPFSRGSSQSRDWTRSPALQADSLLSETPGKPLPIGVLVLPYVSLPLVSYSFSIFSYEELHSS